MKPLNKNKFTMNKEGKFIYGDSYEKLLINPCFVF